MQSIFEYNWVPNWLTRQRKQSDSNTSLFGIIYSEILSHETLSNTIWSSSSTRNPLHQPCEALHSLYGPLHHSCSLCMDDAGPSGLYAASSASAWLPLAQVCLSLLLRWSLGTISASLPRTHCPLLQLITDLISLSKPRSRKSNDWSLWCVLQPTLKPPLILFLLVLQRSRLHL